MTVSIRASLLLSAFAMAGLTAAFVDAPEAEENAKSSTPAHGRWSYGGEAGPAHWADLSSDNKTCGSGAQQSPVDLATAVPSGIAAAQTHWTPSHGGMVINNGHTIQVEVADGGGITLDGKDYTFKQFHFHHPSEHTIDGKQFPLEAHFVHAAADGDIAVVGVLFMEGSANPSLDAIWATAPAKEGKAAVAFAIDASKMVPTGSSFRYEGSLTTPPCSETVRWTVMAAPQTVSPSQIAAFATLFPSNARPVQPLNRRYVLKTAG